MGRLVHQKGFDTLIAAFGTIAERWPDWSLTIVGEGPERGALERMARDAGCAGRVHFAGRVNDPRPVLSTASVFVLPSRFEGFPNALVEAMASGCAVVATDCPSGPAEIVEDGHDGILVPVDRSDRLAAALEDLLDNEQRRVTLGAAARIAVRRFNLAAVAAQWLAVVEEDHALTPGAEAQTWVR
jgi:glycosyltransferase involved in cell wall biosynthesis